MGDTVPKRFKTKKKISIKRTRYTLYIILIVGISLFTFNYIYHLKFATNNEEFIKYMLEDSNHFKEYNTGVKSIVYKLSRMITGVDMNEPASLLETQFFHKNTTDTGKKIAYTENSKDKEDIPKKTPTSSPTPSPAPAVSTAPLVYIYSTHQTEGYTAGNLTDFGITPDVMMAAYLLKDRLEKLGTKVIIEERKMGDYLKQNGLNYDKSYTASRFYLNDTLKKYPDTIDLVIDLHRDALAKNLSTTTIGDKNYAKILFVLGGKAANYQSNLSSVTTLNNEIKAKYPTLTRGLLARDYSIYNQDLKNPSILLELGGNENTVDEVMNTVEALAPILHQFVGGIHGK